MGSFEKKISETFLNLKIPFVDYGITRGDCISLEGIFRNPEFPNLSQSRNQLFRMASMTKPITAYLTLAVMVDGKLIEKPVLRQMQRTVEISNKLKSSR